MFDNFGLYVILAILIVLMFNPFKYFRSEKSSTNNYANGYASVVESLKQGTSVEHLWSQYKKYGDAEGDSWDNGWKQACLDNGIPDEEF